MEGEMPTPNRFNVRVYGIIRDASGKRLLLTRERMGDVLMTKFPGGGLEFGEGLEAGLKREMMEELKLEVKVGKLFYINEFFQRSAFKATDQLLSVYYEVSPQTGNFPETFSPRQFPGQYLEFFWHDLKMLPIQRLSFPIDKIVVQRLKDELI